MKALTHTIDTLYDEVVFVTNYFFSIFKHEETHETRKEEVIVEEARAREGVRPESFRSVNEIFRTERQAQAEVTKNTLMYTATVSSPVYKEPTLEFDSQIGTIPYGEMVMMIEVRRRFFKVVWNSLTGWVLREDLVDRAASVYPEFVVGEENSVDHRNTAYIRAIIGDTFGMSRTEFPLQSGEYILYKLWRKHQVIEWTNVRPRTPGLWHKILRGVPRIHIGMVPKVGSIMEYMINSEVGHLAYVEAVFPDETISISEVNYPDSGIYNERELDRGEWRELKPIFIHIQ